MNQLIKWGLLSSFFLSSTAYAIDANPVQGVYVGILAGITHALHEDHVSIWAPAEGNLLENLNGTPFAKRHYRGIVGYTPVGAAGGGLLGYRLKNFRAEAELLYSRISTGPLQLDNNCTIENANILTPSNICNPDVVKINDVLYTSQPSWLNRYQIGYEGHSSATYGLFNFYYDMYTPEGHMNFFPYIGIGFGGASIVNSNNLVSNDIEYAEGFLDRFTSPAVQGIFGLSFFMDDYTTLSMDARYTTTTKSFLRLDNKRYGLISLMFTFNFALDVLGIDC